jgi:predicted peptidase
MRRWLLLASFFVATGSGFAEDADLAPFEVHSIEYTGGKYEKETFRYLVLKPLKVEAGETYPLVLFLHGAGERGDDPAKVRIHFPELWAKADHREKFACFLIVPQCREGEQWVNAPWTDVKSTPMGKEPSAMLDMANEVLDKSLKEFPVDKSRVYLTGLSMGGYGSWELAMRRPEVFAALAPICGGGDEAQAAKLKDIPIWTAHGDADTVVPVERSRRMVQAVKDAGGRVHYEEYPKVGHNSWTPAYTDPEGVLPWMFQQQRHQGKEQR